LNLYIMVLSNTYPSPAKDIETSFDLDVGDVFTYQLPQMIDPEGNDDPEVYIDVMDAQEEKYPPFLMYENATNTIVLRPNSTQVQGRTYYFEIIVKEKNSDSILYPYYCTVKINGEIVEINNAINFTDVNYTINYLKDTKGSIKFSHEVNMGWLEENWFEMFKIYWTDTEYSKTQLEQKFLDFRVDDFGSKDNMTVSFTMIFE
jgi:hypothetical protein